MTTDVYVFAPMCPDDRPSTAFETDPELLDLAGEVLDGRSPDSVRHSPDSAAGLAEELDAIASVVRLSRALHRGDAAAAREARTTLGSWGHLELLERVGSGAFGEVFRAWDTRLDREVALKLMHVAPAAPPDAGSVIAEGRLLAKVRHPNVVTVYGADTIGGRVGIWTEFVHGHTLAAQVAARGPLPVNDAIAIGRDICHALSALHASGVVHGDVKAQNVLRTPDGRVVLVDLGTARERLAGHAAQALAGTPLYLAPELWQTWQPTVPSDIYSLGVVLYHLVTGDYPIAASTTEEVQQAHADGNRRQLSIVRSDLPAAFSRAVDRALATDPQQRFASADDFDAALGHALPRQRWTRPARFAALVIFLAGCAGLASYLTASRDITDREPAADAIRQVRKQLESPTARIRGRPSRDGRYLPLATQQGGVLLWDRTTGAVESVVEAVDGAAGAEWSLASPDGSSVAYSWVTDAGVELRLKTRAAAASQVLANDTTVADYDPVEFSADGAYILCWFNRRAGGRDLALVSARGGTPILVAGGVRTRALAGASISPDSRFVVYDAYQHDEDMRRDIMIVSATAGAASQPVQSHPADDFNARWTAEGNLLFVSDRGRQPGLYHLRIRDGQPSESAERIVRDVDVTRVLGLSASGALLYEGRSGSADVHLVPVDLSTPHSTGRSRPVDPLGEGGHTYGNWSADGGVFIYGDNATDRLLVIGTATNATREVRVPLVITSQHRLSPDGRRVAARARDQQNREGFFVIDLGSRRVEPLVIFDTASFFQIEWAADSRRVFFRHADRGIVEHDITTHAERILIPAVAIPGRPAGFGVRRDGAILVASEIPGQDGPETVVRLWRDAAAALVVARLKAPARFSAWIGDADEFAFVQRAGPDQPIHLWVMPLTGRVARDIGPLPGYRQIGTGIAIRPDGKEVAYLNGTFSSALFELEHFLSGNQR